MRAATAPWRPREMTILLVRCAVSAAGPAGPMLDGRSVGGRDVFYVERLAAVDFQEPEEAVAPGCDRPLLAVCPVSMGRGGAGGSDGADARGRKTKMAPADTGLRHRRSRQARRDVCATLRAFAGDEDTAEAVVIGGSVGSFEYNWRAVDGAADLEPRAGGEIDAGLELAASGARGAIDSSACLRWPELARSAA